MKIIDRKNGPWPRDPYPKPVGIGKYRNAEGEVWTVINADCPAHLRRENWRLHVTKQKGERYYTIHPKKFVQWFDGPTRLVKWRKDRPLGQLKVGWSYISKHGQRRTITSITQVRGVMERFQQVTYHHGEPVGEAAAKLDGMVLSCELGTFRKWFNGKGGQ